jgi:RraA family protein
MSQTPQSAHLHPGPGFRIRHDFPRPNLDLKSMFADFSTPEISDQLNRLYAIDPSIRCLTAPHHRLAGPVCTVKLYPGDNLMVHKVLDVAHPGDIVLIDASASPFYAVLGDTISTKAKHRGIAGFVVDGFVRDLPGILELDFPVFARGTTPIGPLHRGPGEINYPIACGGVVAHPGDAVIADATGVVIVPQAHIVETHERLQRYAAATQDYLVAVGQGHFSNQWVDDILAAAGCPSDS